MTVQKWNAKGRPGLSWILKEAEMLGKPSQDTCMS